MAISSMAICRNLCSLGLPKRRFLAAIEADPSWAIPYCNQGRVYFNQGKRNEARRCFEKAYELARSRRNVGDDVVLQEIRLYCPDLI